MMSLVAMVMTSLIIWKQLGSGCVASNLKPSHQNQELDRFIQTTMTVNCYDLASWLPAGSQT